MRATEFTRTEKAVAEALRDGVTYDAYRGGRDEYAVVRASVIRDLLRGHLPDMAPDPSGMRLRHVRVEGRLNLDHLEVRIPLDLYQCELPEGLTAAHAQMAYLGLRGLRIERNCRKEAVLHLENLRVRHLDFTDTTLINAAGCALRGDDLNVESSAVLTNLTATGAVRLLGACIADQLVLTGANLTNKEGPALHATGISVGAEVFLNTLAEADEKERGEGRKFKATGSGQLGAVRMPGATIAGQLILRGAELINSDGPALDADGITVGWHAYLDEGFSATGGGDGKDNNRGTVRLSGATITGRLVFTTAELTNHTGPVLVSKNLTAGLGIHLDLTINRDFEIFPEIGRADSEPDRQKSSERVNLFGVDAGPLLDISKDTLESAKVTGDWNVTGLVYKTLNPDTEKEWLDFLKIGTAHYSPQPYRQFVAAANLEGDEVRSREAHIAQRKHQLFRSKTEKLLNRRDRMKSWLLWWSVGYGYHSWRAFWFSLGILAVAVLASFLMSGSAVVQPHDTTDGNPGGPCSTVSLWILALETVPLAPLSPVAEASCVYVDTPLAMWHLAINVFAEVLAGLGITLFIAGYTNLIRKPGP